MKKSERLRLAALQALDAAKLTADQKSELATLVALAAAHTDPAKDTDDPAPAPAAAAEPTARTVIAAAFHSLRANNAVAADLATARASIASLTTANSALTTEVATLRSANTSLSANISAIATFIGLTLADLSAKSAAEVTKLIGEKVSALALEEIASLGLPVGKLPAVVPSSSGAAAGSLEEIQTQLAAERDPVKAGQLAAQANKLRDAAWGGKN